MGLTERQIEMLKNLDANERVVQEIKTSDLFASSVMTSLYRNPAPKVKSVLLKALLKKEKLNFQPTSLTYHIGSVFKSDEKLGMDLLIFIIRNEKLDKINAEYLGSEIGSLNENKISTLFQEFKRPWKRSRIYLASFLLVDLCKNDFTPLINCLESWISRPTYKRVLSKILPKQPEFLKEWMGERELLQFFTRTARRISEICYTAERDTEAEEKKLLELVKGDLAGRGIKAYKTEKDFKSETGVEYAAYTQYLLNLYYVEDLDEKTMLTNLSRHAKINEFMPELKEGIKSREFEHPICYYLNYEKEPKEASIKLRELVIAENVAKNYSYEIVYLWDLEESLKFLDKFPKVRDKFRKDLINPDQFENTLSEITVMKMLSGIGRVDSDKGVMDATLVLNEDKINIDVHRPKMDSILEYGGGGGIHPHSKASILRKKSEKPENIRGGESTPYLIVFDVSHSNLDEYHVINCMFGNLKYGWPVDKRTGNAVGEGYWFREPKEVGLEAGKRELISAVLLYRKKIFASGIAYSSNCIPNPYARNPIPEKNIEKIKGAFNKIEYCPLISPWNPGKTERGK